MVHDHGRQALLRVGQWPCQHGSHQLAQASAPTSGAANCGRAAAQTSCIPACVAHSGVTACQETQRRPAHAASAGSHCIGGEQAQLSKHLRVCDTQARQCARARAACTALLRARHEVPFESWSGRSSTARRTAQQVPRGLGSVEAWRAFGGPGQAAPLWRRSSAVPASHSAGTSCRLAWRCVRRTKGLAQRACFSHPVLYRCA